MTKDKSKSAMKCITATELAITSNLVYAPIEVHVMLQKDNDDGYRDFCKYINGCGSELSKFDFVPDTIYGTYIGAACGVHDIMYAVGITHLYKETADRVFLNNMLRIIDHECKKWYKRPFKMLMKSRAYAYYLAVKNFGSTSFWHGKNKPHEDIIDEIISTNNTSSDADNIVNSLQSQ